MKNLLFHFKRWRTLQWLHISCWLWKLRGLESCKQHGFYSQSWINGNCKECQKMNIAEELICDLEDALSFNGCELEECVFEEKVRQIIDKYHQTKQPKPGVGR